MARRSSKRSKESKEAKPFQGVAGQPRQEETRRARPRVLILCEGEATEPNYFKDLKMVWRLSAMEAKGYGYDPRTLVAEAKERMKQARKDKSPYDSVWCVFDRDEHATYHEALDMAKANGIHVAVCVPSFELWYLLHFKRHHTDIDRDAARSAVKKYIPGYEKALEGLFGLLQPRLGAAMANARWLRETHHPKLGQEAYTCPWCDVDQLVRTLMPEDMQFESVLPAR